MRNLIQATFDFLYPPGRAGLLALVLAGLPFIARGQGAVGTIVGTVSDPSGASVASATVTTRNVGTGVERVVTTSSDGLFAVPYLTPATYQITVVAAGFDTAEVRGVGLLAGERREVNVAMKIGTVSNKVTVTSARISDLQLASSEVRGVVDSHTVVELPLNGRDWTSLSLLEPGVAQVRTQKALGVSNDRPNRGLGNDVTVGGNRPQGNNYRLDGVSINDYSSGAPGSITAAVLGVDAVQEFTVVTSNAPAEYGKTSGGVILAASRSGTNSLHGTAYEFLRNSKLDARNFFDRAVVPPFKRNQFGVSAGGPILKDHTFFFGDYEGFRQSLSQTNTITVPSLDARGLVAENGAPGDGSVAVLCHLCTGSQAPQNVPINSAVRPYLPLFPIPAPATVTGSGDTGNYSFVGKQVTNENFATGRIDHRISTGDSLFGTYVFDRGDVANPDVYNFKEVGNLSRRHTLALEETHIFSPTLVNTVGFGFNRDVVVAFSTLGEINPAASNTSLGFNPGLPVGIITVGSGITQFSGGLGAISEYRFHYNSFQAHEDLVWTRNKHSVKLGFHSERIQSNQFTQGASPNGFFTFGGLSSFLQNQPTNFQTLLSTSHTPRDLRQTLYSGFVQDDYKFKPKLSLNLGVRYEMSTVPTETAGQLSTLVNLTDSAPHLGSPYFANPTLRNFAPRVGFAWDPFGTGKTSIRGGFGMYDVLPLPYQFELLTLLSAPFTEGSSLGVASLAQGDFPTKAFTKAKNPTNLRNAYVEPNPHRSYVEQWTLNVQRELFPNFTLIAGYSGSHGVHLPFHADEINDFQPTLTSAGYLWPGPGMTGSRLFPNINGQVSAVMWSASSIYHGLSLEAIKRLSQGLQIQGSYTFSKSIDTSSSGIAGDTFGNSVSSLPVFDPRVRRGLSDFDVRHVLAINAIWMLPSPKSSSGVPQWLASNWQIGGIYTVTSGLPFTPTIGGDPLGLGGADVYAFPNRVAGCKPVNSNFKSSGLNYLQLSCFTLPTAPASFTSSCKPFTGVPPPGQVYCANLFGNSGRNTVIGPGLQDFDFSLFKNNPIRRISETFNMQFRWEIFNLANHANFNPPLPGARQVFSASGALNNAGMLPSPTITSSRQMQFALKMIW